jgi:hypothetical protein
MNLNHGISPGVNGKLAPTIIDRSGNQVDLVGRWNDGGATHRAFEFSVTEVEDASIGCRRPALSLTR